MSAVLTATVILELVDPPELFAVSTYVVVCAGDTLLDVKADTSPMLLIAILVAPEVAHDKVAACPAAIVVGDAVKDEMAGGCVGPPELETGMISIPFTCA